MKKILMVLLVVVFAAASAFIYAGQTGADKAGQKCMTGKDGKCCAMCKLDANVKTENTAGGVVITITAKKGGSDAKAIQEAVKGCCCFKKGKSCAMKKDGDKPAK